MRKSEAEKERPEEDTDAKATANRPKSTGKPVLDTTRLKRVRSRVEIDEGEGGPHTDPVAVSAGPVDKVIELAFNPSRDKIREVTIIDRMQGRLFPIIDVANSLFDHCLQIATYRQSRDDYKAWYKKAKPEPLDVTGELMFRTAQWQKSVAGKNLERATDIALAETETRSPEDEDYGGGGRGFED